ncbi:MAG: D-alanyl-D-alanine dipeptidase [Bacteroidota bacterium]
MAKQYIYLILLLFLCFSCKEKTKKINSADLLKEKEELIEPRPVIQEEEEKKPPKVTIEEIQKDSSSWVDLLYADSSFILDIRYATENNFVGEQIYECGKCLLRKEAAISLLKVHEKFKALGYHIKLFDCYRPHPAQQKLWDKVPNASYVTPPWKGSNHNKGLAVDLTLVDKNGKALDMGTEYDYFGKEAHHDHLDLDQKILDNRVLLKSILKEEGFTSIRTEWWHYNYYGVNYPVSKMEWRCDGNN